ncbi:MAG: glycosyltransferase, partial [Candidatus Limnocylindrales bacterium]
TRTIAGEAGAIVIEESRRGYGRACLTGAERALARDPAAESAANSVHVHDAIAFLDGDGSCDPEDLPSLVSAVHDVDLVLGRRARSRIEAGAMPWHARLGNALVSALLSVRTGRRTHDLPPFKLIRAAALERLDLDDDGYGWTVQFVARALADPGVTIRERPVAFLRRAGGVSKVSGNWKASVRAGRAMISVGWRESRSRPIVAMMAKAPGAGHAKTRLAVDLGEPATAELWAACLRDVGDGIRSVARRTGSRPIAMLARPGDAEPVRRIVGPG